MEITVVVTNSSADGKSENKAREKIRRTVSVRGLLVSVSVAVIKHSDRS